MKKRMYILFISCLLLSIQSVAQDNDDVYGFSPSKKRPRTTSGSSQDIYQQPAPAMNDLNTGGDQQARRYDFDDDEYIDYDDDDYYYTSRIRRFYRPYYRFGYYSSFFMDPFWWDMNCAYPSLYIGWGYPVWYYGNSWGAPGWNSWGWNSWGWNSWGGNNWGWNSWGGNNWGCYNSWSCFNRWNNWNCYNNWGWNNWNCGFGNGYNNGYYNGYWNGYWDGFYNNNYYNNSHWGGGKSTNYVYGPRSSVNSGLRYNRNSIRNTDNLNAVNTDVKKTLRTNDRPNQMDRNNTIEKTRFNDNRDQPIQRNPNRTLQPDQPVRSNPSRENPVNNEIRTQPVRPTEPVRPNEPEKQRVRYPYQNQPGEQSKPIERQDRGRFEEENNNVPLNNRNREWDNRSAEREQQQMEREQRDNRQRMEREERYNRQQMEREQRANQERADREQRRVERQQRNDDMQRERMSQRESRTAPEPRMQMPRSEPRSESPRMGMPSAPSSSPGGGRRR